jgi:hypothetical protein
MKPPITILLGMVLSLWVSGCGNPKQVLFSGEDLIGWIVNPPDKTSLWSVKNGVIFCQGLTNTCLRSEKEYGNYHFHCEWRWPDQSGDGAVGLHTTGPYLSRPNSFEVQLKSPDTGDLYLAGANLSASKMDLILHTDQYPAIRIPKELADTENPTGQWNCLDVFCKDNTIRIFINGFPQNQVINASRSRGSICLICRGSPIEWKNLYLNPLR